MTQIFSAENLEIFWQLTLAVLLGGAIGFERKLARKTAGIRTFALVALGATLFSIIPQLAFKDLVGVTNFDPSRVASQVVVGIGFLGAGLIILQKDRVKGLTTAASMWVSAGIGLAVGFHLYTIAIFSTILTILVLSLLWLLEARIVKKPFTEEEDD